MCFVCFNVKLGLALPCWQFDLQGVAKAALLAHPQSFRHLKLWSFRNRFEHRFEMKGAMKVWLMAFYIEHESQFMMIVLDSNRESSIQELHILLALKTEREREVVRTAGLT